MRKLRDCTKQEFMLLVAIASLAAQLPKDLIDYTRALGEITTSYFSTPGGKRGDHNPSSRSVATPRSVRAHKKYGE
jgi:hypothetical protein